CRNGLFEPTSQRLHAIAERALAREHDFVRAPDDVGIVRKLRREPDLRQRFLDAAQIAKARIHDDDQDYPVSVPLVDGTPCTRGSMRTAIDDARASALNSASMM